jgi:quinoprotein glucose dehydrogenase
MRTFAGIALACAVAVSGAVMTAQGGGSAGVPRVADGDWPNYNRDLAATRYSPLKQITPANVARLTKVWSTTGAGNEVVPLVINGIMYFPAGRQIVAVDAATGKDVWKYELTAPIPPPTPPAPPGPPVANPAAGAAREGGAPPAAGQPAAPGTSCGRAGGRGPAAPTASNRGMGYWPGDGATPARLFFMSGLRLIALDAATGTPAKPFGADGIVTLTVPYNGTPTVYRNVVVIGANVNEVPQGPPGNPRAFDARTGQKLWEFQTVPKAGERFNDTWGDGWKDRSGTNMWGFSAAIDAQRGIVYLPIAGPAANYYGGDRPGNNVYGNSIVAVEAETGKYLWHFQTVHHDIWDSDMPSVGTLVDVRVNGRVTPAIVHVGKTGWVFILDRVTGKPIFGVEERPVPKGDVPTEWYSPTQPFPMKPARPVSRVEFRQERDLVRADDTSAEHVQACLDKMAKAGGYRNDGPFTPFYFKAEGAPPKSTIQFPGGIGGVNWGGTSADPTSGMIYVQAHDTSLVGWVEKKKEGVTYSFEAVGSNQAYDRASVDGVGPFFTFTAPYKSADGRTIQLPCHRPPWARLTAINANSGEIAWEVPVGLTEQLPSGKQNTGNAASAGASVTAGGLVFVGASDRRLRAYDAKSGKELWAGDAAKAVNANPMTFLGRDGRQYVAVVATDTLTVFGMR